MSDYLKKLLNTIPKPFAPESNFVLSALLEAIAESDDEIQVQNNNAKDQIFVRTATGDRLEGVAKSLGVSKPPTLGLTDSEFQELIPNLSLKPKQIKKAFYDTADVFWGPLFSRANVSSNNFEPYNVITGNEIKVRVDNGDVQTIKVLAGDLATSGAATAQEIVDILNRIDGATATVQTDATTGDLYVNLRTDAVGSVGTLEILSSSMIGVSKLDFTLKAYDILDLPQRVSIYNIRPNELLIEIPAIVPALKRTLRGSHHFHTDGTLESPVPTENGIWQGSFFFNPNGSQANYTVTSQRGELQQTISKGDVVTSLTLDDTSLFEAQQGNFVINYGDSLAEGPIKFRGVPNSNTLLIDPSYIFKRDHSIGEVINVISEKAPYVPRTTGEDLAIYFTSPSGAREVVQSILETLKAAGIVLNFVILAPKYKYLIDNPYLSTDDAPSS